MQPEFPPTYRVIEQLSPWVYLIERMSTQQRFVAKCSQDPSSETLGREFLLFQSVDHPNLPRVESFERLGSSGWMFLLDPAPGVPLQEFEFVDLRTSADIARQTLSALSVLHQQGLCHGDLKPQHIYVDASEDETVWVQVIDLGLTREEGPVDSAFGTLRFMAPEMLGADPQVRRSSDLHSFAIAMVEHLTGEALYPQEAERDLVRAKLEQPHFELPENVPFAVNRVLHRLLHKDPGERPDNCSEAWRQFRDAIVPAAATLPAWRLIPPRRLPWVKRNEYTALRRLLRRWSCAGTRLHGRSIRWRLIGEDGIGKHTLSQRLVAKSMTLGAVVRHDEGLATIEFPEGPRITIESMEASPLERRSVFSIDRREPLEGSGEGGSVLDIFLERLSSESLAVRMEGGVFEYLALSRAVAQECLGNPSLLEALFPALPAALDTALPNPDDDDLGILDFVDPPEAWIDWVRDLCSALTTEDRFALAAICLQNEFGVESGAFHRDLSNSTADALRRIGILKDDETAFRSAIWRKAIALACDEEYEQVARPGIGDATIRAHRVIEWRSELALRFGDPSLVEIAEADLLELRTRYMYEPMALLLARLLVGAPEQRERFSSHVEFMLDEALHLTSVLAVGLSPYASLSDMAPIGSLCLEAFGNLRSADFPEGVRLKAALDEASPRERVWIRCVQRLRLLAHDNEHDMEVLAREVRSDNGLPTFLKCVMEFMLRVNQSDFTSEMADILRNSGIEVDRLDPAQCGLWLFLEGVALQEEKEYVRSIEAFRRSVEIYESLSAWRKAALSRNAINNSELHLGRLRESFWREVAAVARKAGDPTRGEAWIGHGNVMRRSIDFGLLGPALNMAQDCRRKARDAKMPDWERWFATTEAEVLGLVGRPREALDLLEEYESSDRLYQFVLGETLYLSGNPEAGRELIFEVCGKLLGDESMIALHVSRLLFLEVYALNRRESLELLSRIEDVLDRVLPSFELEVIRLICNETRLRGWTPGEEPTLEALDDCVQSFEGSGARWYLWRALWMRSKKFGLLGRCEEELRDYDAAAELLLEIADSLLVRSPELRDRFLESPVPARFVADVPDR